MVGSDKPTSLATFVKLTGKSISLCNLCVLCVSVVIGMRDTTTMETQRTQRLHREINKYLMAVDRPLSAASLQFRTLFLLLPPDSRVGVPELVSDVQKSCLDPFASRASTYLLRFAGLPFSSKPYPARCR